jgi:hypothetical protein
MRSRPKVSFVFPAGFEPRARESHMVGRFNFLPLVEDIHTLSDEDMSDPKQFSRLCRFPRDLLISIADGIDSAAEVLNEAESESDGFNSIGPPRGDRVDLNEFLGVEESNYETVQSCLDRRMSDASFRRSLLNTLQGHTKEHLILLLLEPELSIEGAYSLADDSIIKLWGDTPDHIAGNEICSFWSYNKETDEFLRAGNELSLAVDAVSM